MEPYLPNGFNQRMTLEATFAKLQAEVTDPEVAVALLGFVDVAKSMVEAGRTLDKIINSTRKAA